MNNTTRDRSLLKRSPPGLLLLLIVVLTGCETLPGERVGQRAGGEPPAPVISGSERGQQPRSEPPSQAAADATRAQHVVARGDTLFSIGRQYELDFRQIAAWNDLSAPYLIRPGQTLWVASPEAAREAPRDTADVSPQSVPPAAPASPPPTAEVVAAPEPTRLTASGPEPEVEREQAPAAADARPADRDDTTAAATDRPALTASPDAGRSTWIWPASGDMLRGFSAGSDGKQGIQIGGESNGPVWAVADGTVVYSGDDLVGYGNLIILRHADNFFSAYGYNEELLVADGDRVRQGDPIARMGSRSGRPVLHFELRREGRAIDPRGHLPSR